MVSALNDALKGEVPLPTSKGDSALFEHVKHLSVIPTNNLKLMLKHLMLIPSCAEFFG